MKKLLTVSVFLFTLSVLSACSNALGTLDPAGDVKTRFYALSSLPPSNSQRGALRIGVGPIEIPRLLNRPQIISRQGNTEIIMAEQHQWGGSYKEELTQTLTDNLSSLLKTENIERYPWKFSFKPQYQVRVDVERFDGQLGQSVVLKARWRLLKDNKEVLVKRALINTPVSGKRYNDYVKAQSQALATFSRQIAAQINHK